MPQLPSEEEIRYRERSNMADADQINAYLSMSSIKEAAEAAERRSRQQAAERMQRGNKKGASSRDLEMLALKDALERRGGAFKGTSLEAQMLNIVLDPNADPAMKALATQRLERERTVVTPEGTSILPGYNLSGGGEADPRAQYVPKPQTEGEKRGAYVTSNLENLGEQASARGSDQYTPTFFEGVVEDYVAPVIKGAFTSSDYKAMRGAADEWARTMVFLRSGATARQEEVDAAMKNFWPVVNDGPADVARKAQMRTEAEATANAAYAERTGGGGGMSDEDLVKKYGG